MRFLGLILMWLGVFALLGGLALVILAGMQIEPMLVQANESRQQIEGKVDSIREVLADAGTVRQRANTLIEDYKQGEIRNPDDPRITGFFREVENLSYKSDEIKDEIETELENVESLAEKLENHAKDIISTGGLGVILMVISGWLFVFGMLSRKER